MNVEKEAEKKCYKVNEHTQVEEALIRMTKNCQYLSKCLIFWAHCLFYHLIFPLIKRNMILL